ncbi:hypothetical protein K438DRAFT_1762493 [Mycena galopus ATCC 62051]|nr:hypothetical protein K438DRAFT_1762493 [Mycena galopus ATCC 62051]
MSHTVMANQLHVSVREREADCRVGSANKAMQIGPANELEPQLRHSKGTGSEAIRPMSLFTLITILSFSLAISPAYAFNNNDNFHHSTTTRIIASVIVLLVILALVVLCAVQRRRRMRGAGPMFGGFAPGGTSAGNFGGWSHPWGGQTQTQNTQWQNQNQGGYNYQPDGQPYYPGGQSQSYYPGGPGTKYPPGAPVPPPYTQAQMFSLPPGSPSGYAQQGPYAAPPGPPPEAHVNGY